MVGEAKYTQELEWKKHDAFFNNLNEQLKEIVLLGSKALEDIRNIERMYSQLNTMLNLYYPYMINDNKLQENELKLQNIKKFLYSNEFRLAIDNLERLKLDKRELLQKKIINVFDELNTIIRYFSTNISQNDLIPRVMKKKVYDPSKAILGGNY